MEFHAIVVCGPGKALTPFSKTRSTGLAKPLLPIANRPMIEYVLDWCEKAFFPKITVVVDPDSASDVSKALDSYRQSKTNAKQVQGEAEIVGSTEDVYQYVSSIDLVQLESSALGDILHHLYTSETLSHKSFVILPCDFVTDLPPQVLIEAYRNQSGANYLGLSVHYTNTLEIEDKKNVIFPKNYTVYTELADGLEQLLDHYSIEDTKFHKALKIRTQMSWNHPNTSISTKLLNSGIYFGDATQIFRIFELSPSKFSDQYFKSRSIAKVFRDLARRSWRHSRTKEIVGRVTIPPQATFFRSNNLPVLMEANRCFMKKQAQASQGKPAAQKEKPVAHVGADSLVGQDCELGEKTNVKRTVIGDRCTIGKRVKLTGCLILDDVVIGDDTQLENCIIGHHVTIQSKVRLTNSNVESTHEVAKGTQSKGDTLLCFTLEGLVDDGDEAIESESSTSDDDSDYEDYDDEYVDNADGLFAY